MKVTKRQIPILKELMEKGEVTVKTKNLENFIASGWYFKRLCRQNGLNSVCELITDVKARKPINRSKYVEFV